MPGLEDNLLPCPPLTIELQIDRREHAVPIAEQLQRLPAKPGVLALVDHANQPLLLASSANVRRLAQSRLEYPDNEAKSKRADLRAIVGGIRAATVGSAFEADWAYLQWARRLLPATYRSVLDRWQAWFVHVDPASQFPQFTKTAHPAADHGVHFGPFSDKHSAARYIELLQDIFDLCRFHHILIQAPHGQACAYKEMGRCPAPCDGTIALREYHAQIERAIDFAASPLSIWTGRIEHEMKDAADSKSFEHAQRLRDLIERSRPAGKPSFANVARLERFCFAVACRGERSGWVRMFVVRGGWIAPCFDVVANMSKSNAASFLDCLRERARPNSEDFNNAAMENLGLVCAHLYRPRPNKRPTASFVRLNDDTTPAHLLKAIRKISSVKSIDGEPDDMADEPLLEHEGLVE